MRNRSGVALVALTVLAAAVAVPAAANAKKPKLYSVSLSGSTRTELTQVETLPTPLGCTGTGTETRHFLGSATLVAKPKGVPFASYGRLQFKVVLKSLSAALTDETQGSYTVDQSQPFPVDPSRCAFTPEKKTSHCTFSSDATRKSGAEFAVLPKGGKFEFYFNRNGGIVSCDPDALGADILGGEILTKVRSSAVKRLGLGRSVSASATSVIPPNGGGSTTGGETTRYKLKVKRVR